jgi:hypothetical protein
MIKRIELVPASDPQTLKDKLEDAVNKGWEIKGFVSFNNGNSQIESYAVLERLSEKFTPKGPESETEEVREKQSVSPGRKKEVNISIGG